MTSTDTLNRDFGPSFLVDAHRCPCGVKLFLDFGYITSGVTTVGATTVSTTYAETPRCLTSQVIVLDLPTSEIITTNSTHVVTDADLEVWLQDFILTESTRGLTAEQLAEESMLVDFKAKIASIAQTMSSRVRSELSEEPDERPDIFDSSLFGFDSFFGGAHSLFGGTSVMLVGAAGPWG